MIVNGRYPNTGLKPQEYDSTLLLSKKTKHKEISSKPRIIWAN